MLSRLQWAVIAVAVVLSCLAVGVIGWQHDQLAQARLANATQRTEIQALRADRKRVDRAMVTLARKNAATARETASAAASLARAEAANPTWAAQPVPPEVLEVLNDPEIPSPAAELPADGELRGLDAPAGGPAAGLPRAAGGDQDQF